MNYEILVSGATKSSFKINNSENTQIDLSLADKGDYAFQILHFTGSKEHNVKLRQIAKTFGLSLSQYGFKTTKATKPYIIDKLKNTTFENEKDIFQFLEIPYIKPENR